MASGRAIWVNGKKKVSGHWNYLWSADKFIIQLDSIDRTTKRPRVFTVTGDTPEWGNWKRIPIEPCICNYPTIEEGT